jgi:hypothetical protein
MSLSVDMEFFNVKNGVSKWWTYLSFQIPGFTELVWDLTVQQGLK